MPVTWKPLKEIKDKMIRIEQNIAQNWDTQVHVNALNVEKKKEKRKEEGEGGLCRNSGACMGWVLCGRVVVEEVKM